MADLLLTPIVDVTITKLISAIADQINLAVSWKEELRRLKDRLTMIQALLQHAGEKQVTNPAVKLWLERLRDAASDADDVLDEVAYENLKRKIEIENHMRRKVCYFFSLSNPLIFQMKMAKKIKNIIASVDDINKQAQRFGLRSIPVDLDPERRRRNQQTYSSCDVSQVVGRDDEVSRIVELLTDSTNHLPLWVISIVGMGGLGKTTLAQSVRNNERIKNGFAKIIWVCVSENFDMKRILEEMLESVTGRACGNFRNLDTVIQNIGNELAGRNYLLILDDVWNLESCEELRRSLLGMGDNLRNRIVVTTRDERVASIAHHKHHLKELEDDKCLSIIKQRAFGACSMPPHLSGLEAIAREIARKCKGVPLVANVIGGTLRNNMSTDYWLSIKNMNAWELPEGESRILSILRLSFDRLPKSALKQCFAICSIFPKDYVMKRKILVELWMAEGFIQSPEGGSKSMEDIGNEYFNDLLSYSLFQDVQSGYRREITCKMHDLIHDLAQSISEHETVILETTSEGDISNNVRHLNLIYGGKMVPKILGDVAPNLRTLFLNHGFSGGMQANLKRLRVLNLCGADIEELPFCFDNMKSLKFLDISYTEIKRLPKSISKLSNLQTFRFMYCSALEMPSEGIGYLINLRHIHFSDEEHMPANIGRLTDLQTLESFHVRTRKGRKITELGSLSRLKGELVIWNLELVKDKSEAEGAKLHEKAVDMLKLWWKDGRSELELEGNHDEEVLEGLRPHPNLQALEIYYYGGKTLPSWMLSSNELFSPNNLNLVALTIESCGELICIPVINGLSSLKQLRIWDCSKLTSIADRAFEKMSLEKIDIWNCRKLESLGAICRPFRLKELCIGGFSEELEESLYFSFIHHFHPSLEKLSLWNWEKLTQLPHQIQHLTALKELEIWGIRKLDALPEWVGKISSLERLWIEGCENLKCLPSAEAIRHLKRLKELMIHYCRGLNASCAIETGAEWPKISHIPNINIYP